MPPNAHTLILLSAAALCAKPVPVIDNDQVTVRKIVLAQHERFEPCELEYNCVLISFDPVEIRLDRSGETLELSAGQAKWMPAKTRRSGIITSPGNVTVVAVDVKKPGDPHAALSGPLDPVRVDPKHYRIEFENGQVRVIRAHIGPGESTPMHEHRVNRVIAYLTPQSFRLTNADGTVDTPKHQAGDVGQGGPARHAEQNTGDAPFEVVAVELKSSAARTHPAR